MGKFLRLVLFLVLAMATPAHADETGHILSGGVTRSYLIHLPPALPAHPGLILAFHGGGGTAAGMARLTGFDTLADAQHFIVVYPQGLGRHWHDGRVPAAGRPDDVAFIAALIARLRAQYHVDPARIYATGMSNGAIFSNFLGCRLAGELAAIAPVAGTLAAGMTPPCSPARPLSVLLIDGTADPIVPFAGGDVRNFHHRGVGGGVTGGPATARFWMQADGCGGLSAPDNLPPVRPDDPTRLEESHATACPGGIAVRFIAVQGAGHVWPGGTQYLPRFIIGPGSWQMNASAEIVSFFLAHPAP